MTVLLCMPLNNRYLWRNRNNLLPTQPVTRDQLQSTGFGRVLYALYMFSRDYGCKSIKRRLKTKERNSSSHPKMTSTLVERKARRQNATGVGSTNALFLALLHVGWLIRWFWMSRMGRTFRIRKQGMCKFYLHSEFCLNMFLKLFCTRSSFTTRRPLILHNCLQFVSWNRQAYSEIKLPSGSEYKRCSIELKIHGSHYK